LYVGKVKAGMYPMRDITIRRDIPVELSGGTEDHQPIEEPVLEPPPNDPPSIERPPKNDPNEPGELPLQDPNSRPPRRSHPGNCGNNSNKLERLRIILREVFLVTDWKADSKRCSFAR
jgi:hypothetical protein